MRNLSSKCNRQYGKMQEVSLVLASDFTAINTSPWEPKLVYKIPSADIICFKFLIVLFLLPLLEVWILMIAEGQRKAWNIKQNRTSILNHKIIDVLRGPLKKA